MKWISDVGKAVKKYLWHAVKFCNTDDKLQKLTAHVFEQWDLREYAHLDGDDREDAKVCWIAENSDLVRMGLNSARNYANSQLRSSMVARIKSGQPVPTIAEIKDCALRAKYLHDDPDKHWIFEFYWDDILFRIVGKDHWDTYVRHCSTISQAILPNYEKNCITAGTEAFAVALYENCFDRFHLIVEQQNKRIDDKKRTDPRHKTKMIDCDGGQAKWGGWNKVGRDFCADLRKDVVKAREQEHVHEMEDACLDRIRITHDVEARDKRRGAKSRRKRRVEEVEDESDDEDMI